ncbi:MAG TPA: TauD/TfdA family dioxygenase, partial [Usitatibacter sp.]|nr:TauD/TfdA family dioxygenase [Usitatibacter sp.]
MNAAVLAPRSDAAAGSVFDLGDRESWRRWGERKLAARPRSAAELVVEVRDPRNLTATEREALLERCRRANMAIYASRAADERPDLARRVGEQLGLLTLDANPFAGRDGVARIACDARRARAGFIPYTNRRMRWHTDGYYNAPGVPLRAMILHCVRPAESGGETALLDPELAWLMLRDSDEALVRALMHPQALTIPERADRHGIARGAVGGPVFSIDAASGDLH